MVRLTRTVRFAVNPSDNAGVGGPNGFAGSPAVAGLGRHYELQVACIGDVDRVTSYLLDIKAVDKAIRSKAIPIIVKATRDRPSAAATEVMGSFLPGLSTE